MNKKIFFIFVLFFVGFSFLPLQAQIDIRLRILEGIREGADQAPQVVTSSYLRPTFSASIPSKFDLGEEQKQVKNIFNLKDVKLLTEADLRWEKDKPEKIGHIFRLDSKEYVAVISRPGYLEGKHRFRIEVFEKAEAKKKNLLDTEIILPEKNIAVFGFEDAQRKPYFLSFYVLGEVLGGGSSKEIEEFEKGAVKATGEISPPRLIKKVNPVYPEEARKQGVEGIVILNARTDEKGNVEAVQVLQSVPMLDQAAIDALKQWKYEPFIIKGKPFPLIFTVTLRFSLK